jgi:hypothetical protein
MVAIVRLADRIDARLAAGRTPTGSDWATIENGADASYLELTVQSLAEAWPTFAAARSEALAVFR